MNRCAKDNNSVIRQTDARLPVDNADTAMPTVETETTIIMTHGGYTQDKQDSRCSSTSRHHVKNTPPCSQYLQTLRTQTRTLPNTCQQLLCRAKVFTLRKSLSLSARTTKQSATTPDFASHSHQPDVFFIDPPPAMTFRWGCVQPPSATKGSK